MNSLPLSDLICAASGPSCTAQPQVFLLQILHPPGPQPAGGNPAWEQKARASPAVGPIKSGHCCSHFTISGRSYYCSAGAKERSTCSSKVAGPRRSSGGRSPVGALEATPHLRHGKLFIAEFQRELVRLSKTRGEADSGADRRMKTIDAELATLSNLLASVINPTVMSMISARKAEWEDLTAQVAARRRLLKADVIASPALLRRSNVVMTRLCEALNNGNVRGEVVAAIRKLVKITTIK